MCLQSVCPQRVAMPMHQDVVCAPGSQRHQPQQGHPLSQQPIGTDSLNSAYTVPSSARTLGHIMACCKYQPDQVGEINNVYDLPSIEPEIRYLHGAAGFPTKATWLKAIRNGNYLTWPLVNVKT